MNDIHHRLRAGTIAGIAAVGILLSGGTGAGLAAIALTNAATTGTTEQTESDLPAARVPSGSDTDAGRWPDEGTEEPDGTDSSTRAAGSSTAATDEQSAGVVLIETELGYLGGAAAGTGIVLTSDGEILTNRHVIEGSTSITVTIASTGEQHQAVVVGTDWANDIAVLQLEGTSGLTTALLDPDDDLAVGDSVTGVGNAGGQGSLTAAEGAVTALDQQITVADELEGTDTTLSGLIETDAAIVSGDSGGPLLDADGEVVGIDTAASSDTRNPTGYAIPIEDALAIVDRIEAGEEAGTVVIGLPAFLGVTLAETPSTTGAAPGATAGATIAGALEGTPAADAGLTAGDVVTGIGSTRIANGDALTAAIGAHEPGDEVVVAWTDAAGESRSATVTLVAGPAQ